MGCSVVYWVGLVILAATVAVAAGGDVTYDAKSLIINGKRSILFSGSIHYPRSTPDMWPSLISSAKEGGLQVIQTYVFWNLHEPQPGQYDFSGRKDIVAFIKEIQAQGLYVSLRIGPFIESEWTYGGLPFWLHDVPGIIYRSDNKPFKKYMQRFTKTIVNIMKAEKLYASQGGPIILSQIENEYQNVEAAFHERGPPYVRWAAAMSVGLQTGVPWVMCKQDDAPDPVINACNGLRCGETFVGPNSPNKPAIWTENWTSNLQGFGEDPVIRSPEDIAYHTALFIAAKDGSFINYYMYYGGTNLGRTGSAYQITSYYDQAPLDEYGFLRQPKWGHLRELHAAVNQCSDTILSGIKTNYSLGQLQQAFVYQKISGECAAFLVNSDSKDALVKFQNSSYQLPRKSISILPDCERVAFNTGTVNTQSYTRTITQSLKFDSADKWEIFSEPIPRYDQTSLKASILLDHANTTKDSTDYLWYTLRFQKNSSDSKAILNVSSESHVLRAYVNGAFADSAHGNRKNPPSSLQSQIKLNSGMNDISLLSAMVGLRDSGAYLEHAVTGLQQVTIQDNQQTLTFKNYPWGYQVGLVGEKQQVYTSEGSRKVQWNKYSSSKLLTWYKTTFDAPEGRAPIALNLKSMGKGEAWVNGQSIGRYWASALTPGGTPSQSWYHTPRSFLKPTRNLLVLLDEEYGNPLGISIDTVAVTKV